MSELKWIEVVPGHIIAAPGPIFDIQRIADDFYGWRIIICGEIRLFGHKATEPEAVRDALEALAKLEEPK